LREQQELAYAGRQPEPLSAAKARRLAATLQAHPELFESFKSIIFEEMRHLLAGELPKAVAYIIATERDRHAAA
jgi:hypothetical protein